MELLTKVRVRQCSAAERIRANAFKSGCSAAPVQGRPAARRDAQPAPPHRGCRAPSACPGAAHLGSPAEFRVYCCCAALSPDDEQFRDKVFAACTLLAVQGALSFPHSVHSSKVKPTCIANRAGKRRHAQIGCAHVLVAQNNCTPSHSTNKQAGLTYLSIAAESVALHRVTRKQGSKQT